MSPDVAAVGMGLTSGGGGGGSGSHDVVSTTATTAAMALEMLGSGVLDIDAAPTVDAMLRVPTTGGACNV